VTSPRTLRRSSLLALTVVCALVLGGLAWATRSAIELQRIETTAARERSLDEARALALSKLDGLVAPVLGRELARPYEHFRPFYKPVEAINETDGRPAAGSILVASPLRTLRGPEWLLLHFQATETEESERWSSPQIEDEQLLAEPVWVLAAQDGARLATPENWLAALRERYTPLTLLQKLEIALGTAAPAAETGRGPAGPRGGSPGAVGLSRSAAEFIRRGARLVQMQNEGTPGDLCFPELVAFENLSGGSPEPAGTQAPVDCIQVTSTPMKPIWLDLTLDGRVQLAFVRSVTVETGSFCTLQGVLIDWGRLRGVLEAEVRDLFPNATIVPVLEGTPVPPATIHAMMQTIPARLEVGAPQAPPSPSLSRGFKVGLAVAWGATILALAAIGYGTMKYVGLVERRMRFVSAVTHELRTPLTSFQLYGDLLADMPREDGATRRKYADVLRDEAGRLARLVENVLAYSRIGVTAPALRWRPVRPGELLDAVAASVTGEQCRASGKQLVVENQCPADAAFEADFEFVMRVLTNLVENACKYSAAAEDPRVRLIAAQPSSGVITFEVDDGGPGVAPHDRREVFQPFRRGRTDSVKGAGGVGLGLALSRYWAVCLGGRLDLRRSPRNQQRYSNFVLTLPRTRAP
jgi:signal transduction histidine kinase